MRIVAGAAEARRTLLRRAPLDEPDLPAAVRETIRRVFGADLDAGAVVERILWDVRREGEAAVRRYNEQLDGVSPAGSELPLLVSPAEIRTAYSQVEPSLVGALRTAASRIRDYHERQLAHSARSFEEDGLGQIVTPLRRVGLYIPGNTVVYPSTLLMMAVPARVAGVKEVVVATPVAPDGSVSPLKLVAADIAGVGRVFRAGGVQGIAALAYGAGPVPKVDKICGPGNIFVTLAKKRLYGEVGIDGIFGPSETVVVADAAADPELVAADLLAGAEHDELATAILITDSPELAQAVQAALERDVDSLARAGVARASLDARGGAVVVESIAEAAELAGEFAPEHLCLHVQDVDRLLEEGLSAGCLFAGAYSVESIGDYTAGPSHVMPTGGSAAYASPLGVQDFLKVTSLVRLDRRMAEEIGPAAAAIARAEGFTGHARAIESRIKGRAR
ncbi:MAG: histidinol dehydrogenase [Dehalococcoidia bacterium]|nr:histidinol dehydrogenase [Dehalococcoidia bacterium]